VSPAGELARAVDAARSASARQARRPRREIAAALARAAERWRRDPELGERLPGHARLAPETVEIGVATAAEALDADALLALAERELGASGSRGPRLVAHVLASNVPALALPAIALGCLAGVGVLVKSGRADPVSAPVFHRALSAEDPELASTVVATYWHGGDVATEEALLESADVIVATGRDDTVVALARRFGDRVIAHGERVSAVVLGLAALAGADAIASHIALDVALHDQRGCLSPHVVYVEGRARGFAERLAAALDVVAARMPPGPFSDAERAAHRTAIAAAEWDGASVLAGAAGTVLLDERSDFRAAPGRRTVWVRPLAPLRDVLLPGRIECVGLAGHEADLDALRRLGVSRVCPPGRMQRPPLSWPRGQRAPLRTLLGLPSEPLLEVELE
jgi:acyl-CoA reductase-like NAD-dependent aldehyde dehydrogenase